MTRKPSTIACVGALVAGLSAPVLGAEAGQASEAETLRNEVSQLRAEVAELRQQQGQDWMNERRAEQVKTLVRDVLADADTRASLLQEGMNAGYDSEAGNFFLQSGNGNFRLNLGGQIQVRYTYNNQDNSSIDDHEWGFSIPRAKLAAWGHIADPRLHYKLRFAADDQNNDLDLEVAKISYELTNNTWIWGGEAKAPFLREELVSSARQLAAERSLVNEVFTAGYIQGIGLKTNLNERVQVQAALTDGVRSGEKMTAKDFDADNTDLALTGRVDVALAGEWSQADDFTAWSGQNMAAFVGGAVHYEIGETGDISANDNLFAWTVDGSFEHQGWNAFAAVNGRHTDNEMAADTDFYGFVAQGGYNINDTYEPFARYEYIDLDGTTTDDTINLVTVGMNWYNNQHDAKFTADVVWAFDSLPPAAALNTRSSGSELTNLGLIPDTAGEEDQLALRLQYQLLF